MSGGSPPENAERRLCELSEFVSLVTHEINNHLNGLLLQIAVLESEKGDDGRPDLKMIRQMGSACAELVKRLQRFNRANALTVESVDLNEVVRTVCAQWQTLENKRLQLDVSHNSPRVSISGPIFRRLLGHLLHHALQINPAHAGPVQVRTEERGNKALVIVEDLGPAVPPERIEHLFDPFVVVREGADDATLPICNLLARRIRANLEAENRSERGMRFTIAMNLTDC